MTITRDQAQALANLLHQLRPEWNAKSLMTLIGKHRDEHEFQDLCTAAVNVAGNPEKGPAIIFMDGPHWPNEPGLTPWDKAYHRPAGEIPHVWRSKPTTNDRVMQGLALVEKFSNMDGTTPPTINGMFAIEEGETT